MEPLLHFTVPFVMLALYSLKPEMALVMALIALTPDLDILFLVHRSLSHSLIIWVLCTAPFFLYLWWLRPRLLGMACLGFLSILSHLLLDLFSGYTPLLWPLYPNSVWVQAGLNVRIGSGVSLKPMLEVRQTPTSYRRVVMFDAPLFTSEGLMVSIALVSPLLYRFFIEKLAGTY